MASETFIVVTDDETKPDHHVEVPVEQNNLLLVSTLDAQFPGATGLKYRTDTGAFRGLRVADGYVHPASDSGWGEQSLFVVVVKGKRKLRTCLVFVFYSNDAMLRFSFLQLRRKGRQKTQKALLQRRACTLSRQLIPARVI